MLHQSLLQMALKLEPKVKVKLPVNWPRLTSPISILIGQKRPWRMSRLIRQSSRKAINVPRGAWVQIHFLGRVLGKREMPCLEVPGCTSPTKCHSFYSYLLSEVHQIHEREYIRIDDNWWCMILCHDLFIPTFWHLLSRSTQARSRTTLAQDFPQGPLRKVVVEVMADDTPQAKLLVMWGSPRCFHLVCWRYGWIWGCSHCTAPGVCRYLVGKGAESRSRSGSVAMVWIHSRFCDSSAPWTKWECGSCGILRCTIELANLMSTTNCFIHTFAGE